MFIRDDRDIDEILEELTRVNNDLVDAHRELERSTAQLARANERMNELLGMTAHDLRGPIGTIGSFAETLRHRASDRLDPTEQLVLERISHSSKRMLNLVEDLLSLSAADHGGLVLDRQPCDFVNLVRTSVELAQVVADGKGITIAADLPDHPVQILADEDKLEQVLSNLLSNATKYSPREAIVEVDVSVDDDVVLRVADHGVGIPEDELEGIFTPFNKTSSKPTAGESSTGLGLAIVERIVHAHGGRIDVTSKVDVGTTVTVKLPKSTR